MKNEKMSAFGWIVAVIGIVFLGTMYWIHNHDFTGPIAPTTVQGSVEN